MAGIKKYYRKTKLKITTGGANVDGLGVAKRRNFFPTSFRRIHTPSLERHFKKRVCDVTGFQKKQKPWGRFSNLEDFIVFGGYNKRLISKNYRFIFILASVWDKFLSVLKKTGSFLFRFSFRSIVFVLIAGLVYGFSPKVISAPKSVTVTSKSDWIKGIATDVASGSVEGEIKLEGDGTWQARSWAVPPDTIGWGSTVVIAKGYMYVPRGYSEKNFFRYDIERNEWVKLNDLPVSAHYGCDAVYDGDDSIYFIFGGFTKDFYKYDISLDSWEKLPDLLDTVYSGAKIEFDGEDVYVLRALSQTDFWKYDIEEGLWMNLAPTPGAVYDGSSLVFGHNGYMYATRGSNTRTLWQYDIEDNSWMSLSDVPYNYHFGRIQKPAYKDGYIYYARSYVYDYNTATYFYSRHFLRYKIGDDTWEILPDSPQNQAYDHTSLVLNPDDGLIYVLRGSGYYDLWKFDSSVGTSGAWVGPADFPATIGTGGNLIWNGETGSNAYLYATRGSNTDTFYRYKISDNSWETLSPTPGLINRDLKGSYNNGKIYLPNGSSLNTIYIYDVDSGLWSTSAPAPANIYDGSNAIYHAGTGLVYVTRGGATNTIYVYNPGNDSWGTSIPMTVSGVNYNVNSGGRMISDGTNLFIIPGDGEVSFLKYNPSTNVWTELAKTPFNQYYGTDIAYKDGKIIALAGYYKNETWEYDAASNVWRQLPNCQQYDWGRGPYNGASIEYAGGDSFYAAPGFGLFYMWSYTKGSNNYKRLGSYVSDPIDLSYAASWISFTATENKPENTNIIYETRTSSDADSWSEWQLTNGSSIQSPPEKYIQFRITLSSDDGLSSPSVSEVTIAYNSEDNSPSNPNEIEAKSHPVGGEDLISGEEYIFEHPHFTWEGAEDNESGVAGYYVYFGPDDQADPEQEGFYQETTSFLSNLSLSAGEYFLRVKTKDNDGNITEEAWDAFTYVYDGVYPHLTETRVSQQDFSQGELEKVMVAGSAEAGKLQLERAASFWNEYRLSYMPTSVLRGGRLAYTSNDNKFYTYRGGNTSTFWSYDLVADVWDTTRSDTPSPVDYGGYLTEGPEGFLFGSKGINTSTFWMYDIVNNQWSVKASAPRAFYYGSTLTFDGTSIFALTGGEDAFYKYNIQTNKWSQLANVEFDNPNEADGQRTTTGSSAVFDGDNSIYVSQGGCYPYLTKYTIKSDSETGEVANEWTPLSSAPVGLCDGSSITFDPAVNVLYITTGNNRLKFLKYDIASDSWSEMPNLPAGANGSSSLRVIGGYIYFMRGSYYSAFYRFNIEENSWEMPNTGFFGPVNFDGGNYFSFEQGATTAEDGSGNIYIARGRFDNSFGKYNIQTGSFTALKPIPMGIWEGASMAYVGDEGALYLTVGNLRTRRVGSVNNYFLKYTLATDSWEIITTDRPPYQTTYGSSMVYDGSRYIYLTRGENSSTWWRYDTKASAGSRWSAALPTISGWDQRWGARMVYKDGYIYTARGGNLSSFWRFNTGTLSWDPQLADVPAAVYYGGSLVDGKDGYLYLVRGTNTNNFYRYDLTNRVWDTASLPNIPAQVSYGGTTVHSSNRIWATVGTGSNSYNHGLYSYVIGSAENESGFQKNGQYVSEPIDLFSVYRWSNLTLDYETRNNTSVMAYTRTSDDQEHWSDWAPASNPIKILDTNKYSFQINSPTGGYIQVKIVLSSSDQILTPTVNNFEINYYQDIIPPENPDLVSVFSDSSKTTPLTDMSAWYNYVSPHFSWPAAGETGGASDNEGGSKVKGYYVYFGTNFSASPQANGVFQTTNEYTASNLISGEKYYLKIATVDNADNSKLEYFDAFTYQYDATPPINPSDISVVPTGFTASDNFEFVWEPDSDDLHSGPLKLQYRTDGDELGVWTDIEDAGTISLRLPNENHPVGAYQSGKNWFYLRVMDWAGNVSTPISQEYYFSASAPSPPRELKVEPSYSATNLFSFSWENPESFIGEASKLKFYYSINALPNQYNVVETFSNFAGPGPFATQKGENRFYVVAKDEAGNIDYNLYATVGFVADTSSPPPPGNVQIFDTSDRENQEYSVALKWLSPEGIDRGNFEGFAIYRSEIESTSEADYQEIAITTGSAYVDTDLESKRYYYFVKSKDRTNNYSIASSIVSIIPTGRYTRPPLLVAEPTLKIQAFAANVSWATNRVASSFVEFGKAISLGQTAGQVDSVTEHVVDLKGLSADTKYFYRVKFIDQDGNIGTSEIKFFETLPPPTISEVEATDIGLTSANIYWKTNTSAVCTLKYGEGSMGNILEETTGATTHIQKIVGLKSKTEYVFQIDAIDSDNNEFSSDEYRFTTLEQPIVSELEVQNKDNVDIPTVIVKYKTSLPTTTLVLFKAKNDSAYRNFLENERKTEHEVEISGLNPSMEYEIVAGGADEFGIEAQTETGNVTTRLDSRPPGIVTNRAIGKVIGRGKDSPANLYVKIETDESTFAKVLFSKGTVLSNFEQSSAEDPLNTYHLVTIPVDPGQAYSYIVRVKDEAGNESLSKPVTVVVEEPKDDATEIIVNTFSSKFGWISKIWN